MIVPLLKELCAHFTAKFGDEGMKNIVMMHRNALADCIYEQLLCALATEWARANGRKPWTHLFIPDDEVRANRTLDDYGKLFTAASAA